MTTSDLIIIGIVCLIGTVLVVGLIIVHRRWLQPQISPKVLADYKRHWQRIESHLDSPDRRPLAVIEADRLLGQGLRQVGGFKGETVAELLQAAESRLSQKQPVWRAHKLRNRLVHEADFRLSANQARVAVASFKRGLIDIGLKDL